MKATENNHEIKSQKLHGLMQLLSRLGKGISDEFKKQCELERKLFREELRKKYSSFN
jgi:hypothetical protein